MNKLLGLIILSSSVMIFSGCATSRSVIAVPPAAVNYDQAALQKVAVIQSIQDRRVFEDAPKQANIPSLKGGKASAADAELKAKAFARKRNGFGKALGDVVLENGQTVNALVEQRIQSALNKAGYKVVPAQSNIASDLKLNVEIDKFWLWLQPGAWNVGLYSEIETSIRSDLHTAPIVVHSKSETRHAAVTDGAWLAALNKALDDYEAQLLAELKKMP